MKLIENFLYLITEVERRLINFVNYFILQEDQKLSLNKRKYIAVFIFLVYLAHL